MKIFLIGCLIFLIFLWIDIAFHWNTVIGSKVLEIYYRLFPNKEIYEEPEFTDKEYDFMNSDVNNPCLSCRYSYDCQALCKQGYEYMLDMKLKFSKKEATK